MSTPDLFMIVDEDGAPRGVVDRDRLESDATRLMYQLAAAAGDDTETDRIACEWVDRLDSDEFGYVAAGALSLMVRNIVAPLLDVLDQALPHIGFRNKLAESRDHAEQTLGGGR